MQSLYRVLCLVLVVVISLPNSLSAQDCANDTIPPSLFCLPLIIEAAPDSIVTVFAPQFVADIIDNCPYGGGTFGISLDPPNGTIPTDDSLELAVGEYQVTLYFTDVAGNTSDPCTASLFIGELEDNCEFDIVKPVAECSGLVYVEVDDTYEVTIDNLNDGSFDDCTAVDDLILGVSLADENTPSTATSISLGTGFHHVRLWVTDEANNSSWCNNIIMVNPQNVVLANVFVDEDGDCVQDTDEVPLEGWPVKVTSTGPSLIGSLTYFTGPAGLAEIFVLGNFPSDSAVYGDNSISFLVPQGISMGCPTDYDLDLPIDTITQLSFGVQLADSCNALAVDIAGFRLRPCFENYYKVKYSNYSSFTVEDVEVTVDLDLGVTLDSASVAYTDLGNNSYVFAVGDLPSLFSDEITLFVSVDCDLPIGLTKCATAVIEPYTCNDPSQSYDGPSLEVAGACDESNNQVQFSITNVGPGDMSTTVEYNVVEDVVMYKQGPVQLNSSETLNLPPVVADGSTWRLSVPQPDGHPGFSAPTIFVEGCGGLMPDQINQFALDEADPNVSIICQVLSASFDPNDKQAFPRGYGEENYIEANTGLEYLIRFQNTGTDTAFNVVIEDQLDPALDHRSILTGASSFPYRFEQGENGLLRFYFDNIMLPDSNVSEVNSHGFVQFSIKQKPDNPIGTVIENEAAIFFDFNEPIITNTVKHTIGEEFILLQTADPNLSSTVKLLIGPNPFINGAILTLENWDGEEAQFLLYNSQGQLLRREIFTDNTLSFDRQTLASGLYFYTLEEEGRSLTKGKLIIQ